MNQTRPTLLNRVSLYSALPRQRGADAECRSRRIPHVGGAQLRVLCLILLTTGLFMLLASAAQAAPIGALKQYRLPTPDRAPRYIATGSDGNRWFTESSEFRPATIGRITPSGAVTEFGPACEFCILNDIAQGPGNILYYTSNDPILGRITISGDFLDPVPMPQSDAVAGNLAVHGNEIWITDFNGDNLWRYNTVSGQFTRFPVPEPSDVAVDAAGTVWFTASTAQAIGRLNPQTGVVSLTPTQGFPRQIAVAADGKIWFTERFVPQAVGRLDPATNVVTEFPVTPGVGPEGIAASPAGPMWFTQTTKGNIARITADGVITEAKAVKGSEPFGIVVDADGDPWYTMMSANKIAELQLR
jgi:streptogramin lyase